MSNESRPHQPAMPRDMPYDDVEAHRRAAQRQYEQARFPTETAPQGRLARAANRLKAATNIAVSGERDSGPFSNVAPRQERRRSSASSSSRHEQTARSKGTRVGALVLLAATAVGGLAYGAISHENSKAHTTATAEPRDQRHLKHAMMDEMNAVGRQFLSASRAPDTAKGFTTAKTPDGEYVMIQQKPVDGNAGEVIMALRDTTDANGRTEQVPDPQDTIWADWQTNDQSPSTVGGFYFTGNDGKSNGVKEATDMSVLVQPEVNVPGWADYDMIGDSPYVTDNTGLASTMTPDGINFTTHEQEAAGVVSNAKQIPPLGS